MKKGMGKMSVLAFALSLTVLAGCSAGGKPSDGSDGTAVAVDQKGGGTDDTNQPGVKDIVIWTGGRADAVFTEAKLKEYNESHPETNVKMEVYMEDYASTLELAFASKQAPDIFQVINNAQYYVERDMLLPLDEYITDDMKERMGSLYNLDQVNTVDGKTYTLARHGVTYRLIYNKDIFEKVGLAGPPATVEELVEYSRRITEWGKKDGIYGFAMQLKMPGAVGERVIDQIGYRNCISAYDYKKGTYNFSVMNPVLEPLRTMYQEQIMFPGVEGLGTDPMRTQFAAGKIGMYIHGNWESTLFKEDGQFPAQCNWGVTTIPGIGTDIPVGKTDIKNAGKSWGIAATSKNPKEAWDYMEYILSEDYLTQWHESGQGTVIVPSILEKAKSPEIIGVKEFDMTEELDMVWPVSPDKAGLKLEGKSAYDVYAAIILGAVDMEEGLNDLTKRYNEALDVSEKDGILTRSIIPNFDPSK